MSFTKEELEHFKQRLLEEKAKILKDIEAEASSTQSPETVNGDLADYAEVYLDNRTLHKLSETQIKILDMIDDALSKIEDGTYGICSVCGREIGKERLEAIPYASKCVECKNREERRKRRLAMRRRF